MAESHGAFGQRNALAPPGKSGPNTPWKRTSLRAVEGDTGDRRAYLLGECYPLSGHRPANAFVSRGLDAQPIAACPFAPRAPRGLVRGAETGAEPPAVARSAAHARAG